MGKSCRDVIWVFFNKSVTRASYTVSELWSMHATSILKMICAIACFSSVSIGIFLERLWIYFTQVYLKWCETVQMHVSHVIWQRAKQAKVIFHFSFRWKGKIQYLEAECVVWMCTCFPSMADFISLKVVWNSPMKSCLPLESQSHTVHCNKKKQKKWKQEIYPCSKHLAIWHNDRLCKGNKCKLIKPSPNANILENSQVQPNDESINLLSWEWNVSSNCLI